MLLNGHSKVAYGQISRMIHLIQVAEIQLETEPKDLQVAVSAAPCVFHAARDELSVAQRNNKAPE